MYREIKPTEVYAPVDGDMRKLIAAEFLTIDGVIQNEENDGDVKTGAPQIKEDD